MRAPARATVRRAGKGSLEGPNLRESHAKIADYYTVNDALQMVILVLRESGLGKDSPRLYRIGNLGHS